MLMSDPTEYVPDGVFNPGSTRFPDSIEFTPERGEGPYLYGESGEEYLDYLLGSGPMIIGHSHPRVVEAVQDQMEDGSHFYLPSDESHRLARRIVDAVPCADQIRFTSTGTEATYLALRLARAHTGRDTVMKFEGAYHGWHDEVLVSSSHASGEAIMGVEAPAGTIDTAGTSGDPTDRVVTAPYNDLARTRAVVRENADDLAAILVEPVMRSVPPEDGFLAGLREICDEHGVTLIFDEVVTGFRLAWGGGQEYFGVEPDLATYGKAIGGGTPIAAVAGRAELLGHISTESSAHVEHGGTLNGNPLSAAAGNATLDVLEQSGTYRDLNDYADQFRALLDDLLADASVSGQAMGDGPLVDYVITDQQEITSWDGMVAGDSETKKRIDRELVERGLLHHVGGKRYISTAHSDAELDRTRELYKNVFERVV
jgi:glutamate-1-semialdehyde 2,1-aminomutase